MQDTLYEGLRGYGFSLSEGVEVTVPHFQPSFLQKIGSYFWKGPAIQYDACPVVVELISNWGVLAGHALTLAYYAFNKEVESIELPIFQEPVLQAVGSPIKAFHIHKDFSDKDKDQVFILVETDDKITLFVLDPHDNRLIEKNSISSSNLLSVRFVNECQIIMLSSQLVLTLFSVIRGRVLEIVKLANAIPSPSAQQILSHCEVAGNIQYGKDSKFLVFFLIKDKPIPKIEGKETLKVKEFVRTADGNIKANDQFTIMVTKESDALSKGFRILTVDDFFCIQTKNQIAFIKKKFKRYTILDSITEQDSLRNLKLSESGVLCSFKHDLMELSVVQLGDPKCRSRLLDTIYIGDDKSKAFKSIWPQRTANQTNLLLAFERKKVLTFHNVIKKKPIDKVIETAINLRGGMLAEAEVEAHATFGISRCEFYVALWEASSRQFIHLTSFLLNCGDSSIIKRQVRIIWERQKMAFPDVIKVLKKLIETIKRELQTKLTEDLLKDYMHYEFLTRKIKIMPDQPLGQRQIDEIDNLSIIDIFVKIVKANLFPDPPETVVTQSKIRLQFRKFNLKLYFGQFRVLILQNYIEFLKKLLSRFTSDQIVTVMQNYSAELLPFCPFTIKLLSFDENYESQANFMKSVQKYQSQQSSWFYNLHSIEFEREFSTKRLLKELGDFHPDSKVKEMLSNIATSQFGMDKSQHGLQSYSIDQFQSQLLTIEGLRLFFSVCDYVNERQFLNEDDSAGKIVRAFRKDNNIRNEDEENLNIFTSLYRCMLQDKKVEKLPCEQRSSFALMSFPKSKSLSILLDSDDDNLERNLQNFKNIFIKNGVNIKKYYEWFELFIKSDDCTSDKLVSLLKTAKRTLQSQEDNKDLIPLLFDGFCQKTRLIEKQRAEIFMEQFSTISVRAEGLLQKYYKYLKVQDLMNILTTFSFENKTYEYILKSFEEQTIFGLLLDNYFSQELKSNTVLLDDEQVSLQYCRNMLTVCLYVYQAIESTMPEKDLLLLYGKTLIDWKQYEVMRGMIIDQNVLQKLDLDTHLYIEQLTSSIFDQIFNNNEIAYDQEVESHIQGILTFIPDGHPIKKANLAKLKLIQIFIDWGVYVHVYDVQAIINGWDQQYSRQQFVKNIIDVYSDKITLKTLIEIIVLLYQISENALGSQEDIISRRGRQHMGYFQMLMKSFLQQDRTEDCREIIVYILQYKDYQYDEQRFAEVFLRNVSKFYAETEQLQGGKELVEYYIQNRHDQPRIYHLFKSNFAMGKFDEDNPRESSIIIARQLCLNRCHTTVELELLWHVVLEQINEKKAAFQLDRNQTQQAYYCYYYLLCGLKDPRKGFRKLSTISYKYNIVTSLTDRLANAANQNAGLGKLLVNQILQHLEKGLLREGFFIVSGSRDEKEDYMRNMDAEFIIEHLRAKKSENRQILSAIQRIMIKKKEYNHKWLQKLREKYERLEREEEETPAPAEKKVEGEPIERAKPEQKQRRYQLVPSIKKKEPQIYKQDEGDWQDVSQSQIDERRQEKKGEGEIHQSFLAQNFNQIQEQQVEKYEFSLQEEQLQQSLFSSSLNPMNNKIAPQNMHLDLCIDICQRYKGQDILRRGFQRNFKKLTDDPSQDKAIIAHKILMSCAGNELAQKMILETMAQNQKGGFFDWI